jgi:hypothetical protein
MSLKNLLNVSPNECRVFNHADRLSALVGTHDDPRQAGRGFLSSRQKRNQQRESEAMSRSNIRPMPFRFLLSMTSALAAFSTAAEASVFIDNGYHFQQTPFYCGPGSMEMILDSPLVTATNGNVANALNNAAAINLAQGVRPVFENGNIVNVLPGDLALQNSLYSSQWGGFTNLAFATGTGSPPALVAGVMNAADGTGTLTGRAYANWNFAPNLIAGDLASRTIAGALQNFTVPAMAAVEKGAHWINVNGVSSNGVPARNGAYTINGFFVRDPWTGLALNNPGLAALGGLGLGVQAYLRYGADVLPGGGLRLAPWFQYFNPTNPRSSPANAYTIIVDPLAPELPDTIDPNATADDPSGIPLTIVGTDITNATALSDAEAALTSDTDDLDNILSGGTFDTALNDLSFFTLPGDGSGSGDWLIPYDGSGGGCNVMGGVAIDEQTGQVDMAMMFPSAVCLGTLQTAFADIQNGIVPNDNNDVLPEPGTALVLLTGIGGLRLLRRRRATA